MRGGEGGDCLHYKVGYQRYQGSQNLFLIAYGSNREQSLAGSKYRIPEILFLIYFFLNSPPGGGHGNPLQSSILA